MKIRLSSMNVTTVHIARPAAAPRHRSLLEPCASGARCLEHTALLHAFAAYLLADVVGVSGVLSCWRRAFYAARTVPKVIGAEARLQVAAMWTVRHVQLESLIFILVGLELPPY